MYKTCKWQGCNLQTVGKSSYCKDHRKKAREAWKANIADQQAERQAKYATFEKIWQKAVKAGKTALEACTPTPMVVQQRVNPLDDNSPVVKSWHVPQGACGFAWVHISPANCSFVYWLKKQGIGSKAYGGGWQVWVREGGQSIELKQAYASAVAKVLNDYRDELRMPANGVIYSQSRLD